MDEFTDEIEKLRTEMSNSVKNAEDKIEKLRTEISKSIKNTEDKIEKLHADLENLHQFSKILKRLYFPENMQFPGITEYTSQELMWFNRLFLDEPLSFKNWECNHLWYVYRTAKSQRVPNRTVPSELYDKIQILRDDIEGASKVLCRDFPEHHLYDGAFYATGNVSFSIYVDRSLNKKYLLASIY